MWFILVLSIFPGVVIGVLIFVLDRADEICDLLRWTKDWMQTASRKKASLGKIGFVASFKFWLKEWRDCREWFSLCQGLKTGKIVMYIDGVNPLEDRSDRGNEPQKP